MPRLPLRRYVGGYELGRRTEPSRPCLTPARHAGRRSLPSRLRRKLAPRSERAATFSVHRASSGSLSLAWTKRAQCLGGGQAHRIARPGTRVRADASWGRRGWRLPCPAGQCGALLVSDRWEARSRGGVRNALRCGSACQRLAGSIWLRAVFPKASRQQLTKSWTTGSLSAVNAQAMPTWLSLMPVTRR